MAGVGAAITAGLDTLTATLKAAGVPASVNVGQVVIPGAWVTPREFTSQTLDGGGLLRCHVYLIVADTEAVKAVAALGRLLDKALTVLDPDEPISTAEAVALPDSPPLPAYRLTVDLELTP